MTTQIKGENPNQFLDSLAKGKGGYATGIQKEVVNELFPDLSEINDVATKYRSLIGQRAALEVEKKSIDSNIKELQKQVDSGIAGAQEKLNQLTSRTDVITDKLVEFVYWKMAKNIPVMNEEVFIDSLEKMVIDQSVYETIKNMLSSGDKSDIIIGFDLMCRSDIMKSAEYIRSLYAQFKYVIASRCRMHTKLATAFIDTVDDFYHLDDKEFIEYLHQKNLLTEQLYYNLARNVLQALIDSQSDDVALASIVEVTYNMLSYEDYLAKKEAQTIINSY